MLVSRFLIYQTVITLLGAVAVSKAYPLVSQKISNLAVLYFRICAEQCSSDRTCSIFAQSKLTDKAHPLCDQLSSQDQNSKRERIVNREGNERATLLPFFNEGIGQRPFVLTSASLSTLAQLICMISIPYFVALSIGTPVNYLEITAVQLILFLVVSLIPTPGASGVSEGGYVLFLSLFFWRRNWSCASDLEILQLLRKHHFRRITFSS